VSAVAPVPIESGFVAPVVSELLPVLPVPCVVVVLFSSVVVDPPIRSLVGLDVEVPLDVPLCARAGAAVTRSPAIPRPANVPHRICCFIRTPPAP